MVVFDESGIELTRQQRNLIALEHPRDGDEWFERVYLPAGKVLRVLAGKYVIIQLKEGDVRFWNLKEYADHYLIKHGERNDTYSDVRTSNAALEPAALEWYVYFFFNRWRQKWRERKRFWGKKPRTFTLGSWTLKLERKTR